MWRDNLDAADDGARPMPPEGASTDEARKVQASHFESVLCTNLRNAVGPEPREAPPYFPDLLLDRVVKAIAAECQDFDLTPYFYVPLRDTDEISYRQEIMRDLETRATMQAITAFCKDMHTVREQQSLAQKLYYQWEKAWWFLQAVDTYEQAVQRLSNALLQVAPRSQGLLATATWLAGHVCSDAFQTLASGVGKLKHDLSVIRYCLLIHGNSVTVRRYEGEIDYSAAVESTFEKFRRRAVKDYRVRFSGPGGMGHVEAQISDRVALLFPEVFGALQDFCAAHADFVDPRISRFDREIQFYVSYLRFIERFKRAGLPFCYPSLLTEAKEIRCAHGFDLALADKLVGASQPIVCNDFSLHEPERIFVVSGPNQGGKTTFGRMVGQLHYLACLGCPVPGEGACLFLFDTIYTHFEREEDIANLRGKLQDDLVRIRRILEAATPNSLIIMNEIFSSTTLKDAVFLGRKVLEQVSALDVLGVCVTFLSELATLNEKMASFVSTVDPADPAVRTYKVERRPADGLAYAMALAEKYRVTYQHIRERIRP